MNRPRSALPFIGLAAAFVTLGLTSNRVFLYVGVAFLVVGLARLTLGRRR
jgi:hypothetical protein